jgi:putative ABC transport system substrate-binding protein
MRRRDFITLVGGAAAWPFTARAQRSVRMRHIGFLIGLGADDPEGQARLVAFVQGLQELGWTIGRNLRMDYRSAALDIDRYRRYAEELVALAPEVILAGGSPAVAASRQATRTLPIVFANVTDPVGSGFVASLARPGGNVTGFMNIEFGLSGKWLELLKQIAPRVTRVAVLRDATLGGGTSQFAAIQAVAPSLRVEVNPVNVGEAGEIERAIIALTRETNGGMIVVSGGLGQIQRDLVIALAARHRLPAVYPSRYYVAGGGLISYGIDDADLYRRAAGYVDRILKGENPADLPVQAPSKYETVINLKTAKTLGIEVPPGLLAIADEVIE